MEPSVRRRFHHGPGILVLFGGGIGPETRVEGQQRILVIRFNSKVPNHAAAPASTVQQPRAGNLLQYAAPLHE